VPEGGTQAGLRVLDLAGRVVRTLADSRFGAGRHAIEWDGRDEGGRPAAPGLYLVRLSGGGVSVMQKVAFTP